MLKKSALRRIITSTMALLIVTILYFFPNSNQNKPISQTTTYLNVNSSPIFLINKDAYVVRTSIALKSDDSLNKIKELITSLTIEGENKEYLPPNLKPIIPKNTKLLSLDLQDGLLKLNFSKEFLNVKLEDEEKLIEALIYTLTELKEVKEIMLFIEDQKLDKLPQSKINLPTTLDRSFGINKIYDLTNIKDLTKTTIYYIGKEDNLSYYVPITKIDNNKNNKVEIIIEELKTSPIHETNLISYLTASTKLLNYEALENSIALSFNNTIFSDLNNENIIEEVKYAIGLSIKDSLNINKVIFKVDDKIITTLD